MTGVIFYDDTPIVAQSGYKYISCEQTVRQLKVK